ncbi:MAG TPA: hypothetical protein VJJ47_01715 [Candidatus Paceibacterota bacterium]
MGYGIMAEKVFWNSTMSFLGLTTNVLTVVVLLLGVAALWKYIHHH